MLSWIKSSQNAQPELLQLIQSTILLVESNAPCINLLYRWRLNKIISCYETWTKTSLLHKVISVITLIFHALIKAHYFLDRKKTNPEKNTIRWVKVAVLQTILFKRRMLPNWPVFLWVHLQDEKSTFISVEGQQGEKKTFNLLEVLTSEKRVEWSSHVRLRPPINFTNVISKGKIAHWPFPNATQRLSNMDQGPLIYWTGRDFLRHNSLTPRLRGAPPTSLGTPSSSANVHTGEPHSSSWGGYSYRNENISKERGRTDGGSSWLGGHHEPLRCPLSRRGIDDIAWPHLVHAEQTPSSLAGSPSLYELNCEHVFVDCAVSLLSAATCSLINA